MRVPQAIPFASDKSATSTLRKRGVKPSPRAIHSHFQLFGISKSLEIIRIVSKIVTFAGRWTVKPIHFLVRIDVPMSSGGIWRKEVQSTLAGHGRAVAGSK
jgi:hypothetical protein